MTWTLVSQILLLAIVGGLVLSGIATDIIKTHAKGRATVATAVIEAQHKAHEDARKSMTLEGLFDGK